MPHKTIPFVILTSNEIRRIADPPEGYTQWNGHLVAQNWGMPATIRFGVLYANTRFQLQRLRSWYISTDPEFGSKAADAVGLSLSPPENAAVLYVDEKQHIQVLEREQQGWLRLPSPADDPASSHAASSD